MTAALDDFMDAAADLLERAPDDVAPLDAAIALGRAARKRHGRDCANLLLSGLVDTAAGDDAREMAN